jgi:hypothetical protein
VAVNAEEEESEPWFTSGCFLKLLAPGNEWEEIADLQWPLSPESASSSDTSDAGETIDEDVD